MTFDIKLLQGIGITSEVQPSATLIIFRHIARMTFRILAHMADGVEETSGLPVEDQTVVARIGTYHHTASHQADRRVLAHQAGIRGFQRQIPHTVRYVRQS